MTTRGCFLATMIAWFVLAQGVARADDEADKKACLARAPLDVALPACARLADSGRYKGEELAEYLVILGAGFMVGERNDLTLKIFTDAIAADPRNQYAHIYRAMVYRRLKQHDQAITDATRALALPGPPFAKATAHNERATNAMLLKRYAQAVPDFDQAIAIDPKNADAYELRGEAHARLGNDAKALADLGRSLELKPDNVTALGQRAEVNVSMGRITQAFADYDRALTLKPDAHRIRLRRMMMSTVVMRVQPSRADLAIADAERLLGVIPDSAVEYAVMHALYAKALAFKRRGDDALRQADISLKAAPRLALALEARGEALEALGRRSEAIAAYRDMMRESPKFAAESLKRLGVSP